ncbi:MAG: hypothetical protein U5K72_14605 [Balneolaceae bacterium]|nr:hypothetical protein [Balneolaceae bacterium]
MRLKIQEDYRPLLKESTGSSVESHTLHRKSQPDGTATVRKENRICEDDYYKQVKARNGERPKNWNEDSELLKEWHGFRQMGNGKESY